MHSGFIKPGDSNQYVTRLPTLADDIRSTEDAGAILFIPVAMHHDLSDANGVKNETTLFGGWMDHGFFFVTNEARDVEHAGAFPTNMETEVYSTGYAYYNRPTSGNAWWWGAMVGVDHDKDGGRYGRSVVGKSYMHFEDFSDPNSLNIALINMIDTTEGRDYPDIVWNDVFVNDTGHFIKGGMAGAFHGPDNEEASGVFYEDGIAGAFGASRAIGAAPDG